MYACILSLNSLGKGYEYSRTGNPTRGAFERALAAVEHGMINNNMSQ